ncbi:MAG: TVP38/TMEM64 family protein [Rubripirellula sp.]
MTTTPPESNSDPETQDALEAGRSLGKSKYAKPLLLLVMVSAFAVVFTQYGQYFQLDFLATKEAELREFQAANPWKVYGLAFLLYVSVTGLSLPGAAVLTLVYGWYFGFWPAFLVVSFASTAGATIAFLSSRYLLRDSIQAKFGDRLESFNEHLTEEGAFYLFTLRLIPLPFFVINLVMGLTPIKTSTFWWVSQLGMLPGTMVYVYAGSRVPNLTRLAEEGASAVFSPDQLLQFLIAFGLLGAFPAITKLLLNKFRKPGVPH